MSFLSHPRAGVLILSHVDSAGFYVEATPDLDHLSKDVLSDLQLRRHDCDPLQYAFDLDNRVEIQLIETPSLQDARGLARTKKKQLEQAGSLINDGSHNPVALFSYH